MLCQLKMRGPKKATNLRERKKLHRKNWSSKRREKGSDGKEISRVCKCVWVCVWVGVGMGHTIERHSTK